MDDPELIDDYADKIAQIVNQMHHAQIREEVIRFILDREARNSEMKIIAKGELD